MSQVRAGAAYVELMVKDSNFVKGLQKASARLQAFGASAMRVGAGVKAASLAVIGPLLAMTKGFATAGDAVQKMAIRTGLSTAAVSELGFAAEQSGADMATLENGIKGMQRSLLNAKQGSKQATDALAELGLTAADLDGKTPEEQFKMLADGIAGISDPSARAAIAMKLFGRAGQALVPLLAEGAKGIAALQAEARDLGLSIPQADADAAAAFADAWNRASRTIKGAAMQIGAALAPAITIAANAVAKAVAAGIKWIQNNRELVQNIAAVAAIAGTVGGVIMGIGAAAAIAGFAFGGLASMVAAAGTALGFVGTIAAAIFSPVGLVVAAVAALAGYLLYTSGVGQKVFAYLSGVWKTLAAEATQAFGAIANALAAGDINAAAKVLWAFLKLQWAKGSNALLSAWESFTGSMGSAWKETALAIASTFVSALSGLASIWNSVLGFMADGWTVLLSGVKKGWNEAVGFLKKGFLSLHGLVDIVGEVAIQLGGFLIDAMAGVESAWVETIDYLMDAWSMFAGEVKKIWNSTTGFLAKAWVKLKSLFDSDIDVDAEIRRIDEETENDNRAADQTRQKSIDDRMTERNARKAEIEQKRQAMQDGIAQQLEQRRRENAERSGTRSKQIEAIDQEVDNRNAAVDRDADASFDANAAAGADRQASIDSTTDGVQDNLAAMQEAARRRREAEAAKQTDAGAERQTQIDDAQAEFDAALDAANAAKPDPAPAPDADAPREIDPEAPPALPEFDPDAVPQIDFANPPQLGQIDDPNVPALALNPDAQSSIDGFGQQAADDLDAITAGFDAEGMGFGSEVGEIPETPQAAPSVATDNAAIMPQVDPEAAPEAAPDAAQPAQAESLADIAKRREIAAAIADQIAEIEADENATAEMIAAKKAMAAELEKYRAETATLAAALAPPEPALFEAEPAQAAGGLVDLAPAQPAPDQFANLPQQFEEPDFDEFDLELQEDFIDGADIEPPPPVEAERAKPIAAPAVAPQVIPPEKMRAPAVGQPEAIVADVIPPEDMMAPAVAQPEAIAADVIPPEDMSAPAVAQPDAIVAEVIGPADIDGPNVSQPDAIAATAVPSIDFSDLDASIDAAAAQIGVLAQAAAAASAAIQQQTLAVAALARVPVPETTAATQPRETPEPPTEAWPADLRRAILDNATAARELLNIAKSRRAVFV